MDKITILIISIAALSVIFITIFLLFLKNKKKKKIIDSIDKLTVEKNIIITPTLITEIKKAKNLANSKKIENQVRDWEKRYKEIETKDLDIITNKIIEIENLMFYKDFNKASELIIEAERNVLHIKAKATKLLNDIKTLTESEERNRELVTKLKSLYREVVFKYNKSKSDYKDVSTSIELQFENIDKLFSAFEVAIANSEYEEISKIVKVLDDMIQNMDIIIDEAPTIILMASILIPKKMNDIKKASAKLIKEGYNIEYLNIEYNISETNKKLNEILDRLKVLNVQDSVFELKTFLDYYETLYTDFDKEKKSKRDYERALINLGERINRVTNIVKNLYNEIGNLKETYDLTTDEIKIIDKINKELIETKDSFKLINDRTLIKVTPYSKLNNECEKVAIRLSAVEDNLENTLKNLGSLKEDEARARDQLFEIKSILKDSKYKIKEYNLPVIPKKFYIELKEAYVAVKEINKELEKKPISIKTLNLRVDTARDLALKLYQTAAKTTRTASMAEKTIVYGNRYRSEYKEIENGLIAGTKAFYKGDYKTSLEIVLNSLNIVEPGIHKKLINKYE